MKLSDLLPDSPPDPRFTALEVTGVTADSRKVAHGNVFVAIAGGKSDGLAFVPQAIAGGAAAIVADRDAAVPAHIAFVKVADARRALALIAAKVFPRQPGTIAAVTGTSGKTSVAAFTRQIWSAFGHQAASIGTIGVVSPRLERYGSLTTPDPVALHATLDELAREGVTHLAIEASSHGLDQRRLDGLHIAAGAFTNLSRDHLDYHPSVEAYLQAKLRLFSELIAPEGTAVVNIDDAHAPEVIAAARKRGLRLFTVGGDGEGIRLVRASVDGFAQSITIEHAGVRYDLHLPLVGAFQVANAIVAAGLAIATGSTPAAVFAALEDLEGAKGRLEFVGRGAGGAPVFIDYAHKPDALAKTLEALRPYVKRRLIVVFGCGGERDKGKRPLMGEIAARLADRVIVTDDNPRREDPAAIRAAVLTAAPGAIEIPDRDEAIRRSIAALGAGDVLVIAGKGHETGQIVGEQEVPFSDHETVAEALGTLTQ